MLTRNVNTYLKQNDGWLTLRDLSSFDPSVLACTCRLGDRVRVNCTSSSSHPAPHLKWFINGKQVDKDKDKEKQKHKQVCLDLEYVQKASLKRTISKEEG